VDIFGGGMFFEWNFCFWWKMSGNFILSELGHFGHRGLGIPKNSFIFLVYLCTSGKPLSLDP
jgi:hypothetical protein